MKLKRLIGSIAVLSIIVCCISMTLPNAYAADNTSFATAIPMPGTMGDALTATGIVSGQGLYYTISLSANQYVYFALYGIKDYDLYFYNPSQTLIASSTYGASSPDYIAYTVPSSGTYYIVVRAYSGAGIIATDSCTFKGVKTCGTVGTSSTNSSYSRSNAYTYADTWWNGFNTNNYPNYEGADCANFVSQCLQAGGMSELGTNWSYQSSWFCNTTSATDLTNCSITWRDANSFTTHWGTNSAGSGYQRAYECKYLIGKDISNNFSTIKSNLQVGDVIQMTTDSNTNRYHTLIVYSKTSTDVTLACHTDPSNSISLSTLANNYPNKVFAVMRIKAAA